MQKGMSAHELALRHDKKGHTSRQDVLSPRAYDVLAGDCAVHSMTRKRKHSPPAVGTLHVIVRANKQPASDTS
jgi:hypothetical protein